MAEAREPRGMRRADLAAFLESVYASQERELLCSEFAEALPAYVDWVAAGRVEPADPRFAAVAHHARQCPECGEACEALLAIVRSGPPPASNG